MKIGRQRISTDRIQTVCLGWTCALAAVMTSAPLLATPPGDPICGSPSSQALVSALRAQRAAAQARRTAVGLQNPGPLPRLSIEGVSPVDQPRLLLQGAAGRTYHLETTIDLGSPQWAPWLSVVAGNEPLAWVDEAAANLPARFFRLREDGPEGLFEPASNFRLLDAQGIARDLYYHTHLAGITVVAAGTNLNHIAPLVPLLTELDRTHATKVQTWVLLSDPSAIRSNVLAQANGLGIGFPVLLDPHGLAARSVGLTQVGEVALIRSPEFTVAYRGEAGGPGAPLPAQSLLGRAVAGLVDNLPVAFLRTPVHRSRLAHSMDPTPDYARDIAPLFRDYCAKCHRADGVAPFALTNYSVAAEWAPRMKHAVLSGQMPPWHADPDYGTFANDLSLPGRMKSALARWVDAGAPRGDGPDPLAELPPPPAFDRWPEELGAPDALVTIPVQPVKATGSEAYRYVFTHTPNPTNVWLRAAIIRPSNYRAVHHYLVWLGHIGNSGAMDFSTYQSHIAEFVPGNEPFRIPPDAGIRLGASNRVTFNLHYTPYGMATNDRPVLALWYHKTAPSKNWVSAGPANTFLSIPPQARDHAVQVEWTTPTAITLHRMNPHMHVRGKRVRYEVIHPGGRREVLLSVPDYDFNWQVGYALAEPKYLPAGSRLVISGAFDNSPQNLANPNPAARVRWGDQSWMEMFVGFIDYTQ